MGDVAEFKTLVQSLDGGPWPSLRGLFVSYYPLIVARAPGRLEVVADDEATLHLPIDAAVCVAAQRGDDRMLAVVRLPVDESRPPEILVMPFGELRDLAHRAPESLRERLTGPNRWVGDVVAAIPALEDELGLWAGDGLRLLVRSDLPTGHGLGEAAALQVAALHAITHLIERPVEGDELVRLCRLGEQRILGVEPGGADHGTAALGRAGHLLLFRSGQPPIPEYVPVPSALRFWGLQGGGIETAGQAGRPPHVRRFAERLGADLTEETVRELGRLLSCGDTALEAVTPHSTDARLLLKMLRDAGPETGLLGAGCGPSGISVLGRADARATVVALAARYEQETGRAVTVISGSSPGACEFGCVRL